MPKRDLEIIRALLLRAEEAPLDEGEFVYGMVDFMDAVTEAEAYHLILMRDAGLVEGRDANLGLFRITNSGHDYLDTIRNEGVWVKTKQIVAAEGGSMALELVKSLALGFARKQVEDRTGMKL